MIRRIFRGWSATSADIFRKIQNRKGYERAILGVSRLGTASKDGVRRMFISEGGKLVMKSARVHVFVVSLVLMVTYLFAPGCATAPKVQKSGFLADYSKLQRGPKGGAALVYIKPGVNWAPYDKVIVEPVIVWYSEHADYKGIKPMELMALTDYFNEAIVKNLEGAYSIVGTPGPGVLRIRVAITNVIPTNPTMDAITGTVPQTRLLSAVSKATTGKSLFVGEASAEFELRDAQTNDLLAEAVDRRAGEKKFLQVKDNWTDAKEAMDYWAKRLRQRLDEGRALSQQ